MSEWIPAFPAADLARGDARVVTRGDDHVAVFHADEGFFAVDARCPHEGYPLAKGDVIGCTLTCRWHNYKFDLRDGRCLVGDEAVRAYPLRVVDGRIEIDVTAPPRGAAIAAARASLDLAMARRRMGQAARDVVRLLRLGVTPAELALAGARFDAIHGEYGTGHALPVAADVVAIARRRGGTDAAVAVMAAIEMAAENAHVPVRDAPAEVEVPAEVEAALGARIDAEDAEGAAALLAAALAHGATRRDVEHWLLDLACRHFVDFGHGLIYVVKAFELLDEVGWSRAAEVLPALARGMAMGTREDVLPEWTWFRTRMAAVEPRLDALFAVPARPTSDAEVAALATIVADGERVAGFDAITAALAEGMAPGRIVDALVHAASLRLLRFDDEIDHDRTIQEDWLSVTHILTYASAARAALARLPRPGALRPLWFAARFASVSRALDARAPLGVPAIPSLPPERGSMCVAATVAAAERRDSDAAIHHAAAAIGAGAASALADALEDFALARGATRPIVLAHQIKLLRAARAEATTLPLLAAVRFVAAPVQERRSAQLVHEAERFLIAGKVPRTLT